MNSHIQEIEDQGFTVIKNWANKITVDTCLSKIKELEKTAPVIPDEYNPRLNKGFPNIYNLAAKDKFFIDLFTQDLQLDGILRYFLNDIFYSQIPQDKANYIIRSLGARSSGANALPLHIDNFLPSKDTTLALQCILFLEPSTIETGCTINIKGSHKSGEYAQENRRYLAEPVEAEPGSLYIQDARISHGSLPNKTTNTRWSCVMTASRWFIKQHFDCETIPEDIFNLCTSRQRAILGFASRPLKNELNGVDIKRGYEDVNTCNRNL